MVWQGGRRDSASITAMMVGLCDHCAVDNLMQSFPWALSMVTPGANGYLVYLSTVPLNWLHCSGNELRGTCSEECFFCILIK